MKSVLDLVRADLRDFDGYKSARSDRFQGRIWLNANESAWANEADLTAVLRRYPDPQPPALRAALADLYRCAPEQLLAGRGSDEGIDLLLRALCRPGDDAIVISTPTFGMYAVCARLHGTRVIDVPLVDRPEGLVGDFAAVAEAAEHAAAKLVFLCSPGNPSGTLLPLDAIAMLAARLRGRAVVVVDEAYIEYADAASAVTLVQEYDNIAVLRTLSKAHALAAARIGSLIASPELIPVLQRCQAPYPLPEPCVEAACRALAGDARASTAMHVATTVREREMLQRMLPTVPGVRHVYPSRANFVLVRFDDAQAAFERLLAAGIVVRDLRAARGLGDALRITLGTSEQNACVIRTLRAIAEVAA